MFEHLWTIFSPAPEISTDADGFDAWTNQGVMKYPSVDSTKIEFPRYEWLKHTELKSPWLYLEKATPNAHTAYTDIGDKNFVSTNGSCDLTSTHPSFVLNRPAKTVHITLEDVTRMTAPKKLWDNYFTLKNTAPGGNGVKIVGYQQPIDPPEQTGGETGENESAASGGKLDFVPFCFNGMKDIDFTDTKYRLTVESLKDDRDLSIVPFKDVMILRPRPLCDIPINLKTFIN